MQCFNDSQIQWKKLHHFHTLKSKEGLEHVVLEVVLSDNLLSHKRQFSCMHYLYIPNMLKRVESEAPVGFPGFQDPLFQIDSILFFIIIIFKEWWGSKRGKKNPGPLPK